MATDTHLSVVIFWREGDDGPEYLAIEYTPKKYDPNLEKQIKFPGGTNKDRPGEIPLETAHREIRKETSIVMPTDPNQIYVSDPRPDREVGGFHRKYGFLMKIEDTAGEMRTVDMDDDGDHLSPPFWRTFGELMIEVKEGGLFYTHRPILEAAHETVLHQLG